ARAGKVTTASPCWTTLERRARGGQPAGLPAPPIRRSPPVSPSKPRKPTAAEKAKAEADKRSVVARNKKARYDYHIDETIEAGLSLTGTEVKSLRMGRASLVDGWVEIDRGEAWLQGAHI